MRTISANGLAKLATKYGNEPVTIVEIDWTSAGPLSYSDKTIGSIPGKIIEVGVIDNVVNVSQNTSSQQLTIVLDDTDGSIKRLLDTNDAHKRPARIYQYFTGLALTDKFLVFAGKLNTPITWNERDRTVTVTIVSQLEDKEIGFSAEEGQFPYLPADLVGKAWPMIFGTVLNCPALQINHAVTGTTLTGAGILSGTTQWTTASTTTDDSAFWNSLVMTNLQMGHLFLVAIAWQSTDHATYDRYMNQYRQLSEQRAQTIGQHYAQRGCESSTQATQVATANAQGLGDNPIRILGGEDFPQNQTITLKINGGYFVGHFDGEYFTVGDRYDPEGDAAAAKALADRTLSCSVPQSGSGAYRFEDSVPVSVAHPNGVLVTNGWLISTSYGQSPQGSDPVAQHFWAEAGASVSMGSYEALTYIASIVPGTVLAVKAYKQLTGERRLTNVPSDLYTVNTQVYGTVTAVQVVLSKSLSSLDDGWSDDLYITFQSSVGPDTVNILKYLITNYTGLTWDATSFNHVQSKLVPFPANFPLLERRNTVDVLQDIAFQARCAIWLSNGVFYLKYLPETPTSVSTITVSDVDAESMVVDLTPTENLVTKMKIKWRMTWAAESDRPKDTNEKTIILRHNVAKYGTQEKEYDWFIYNQPDIIYKAATFWLIRLSNTWKTIQFKTYLNKLNVETFDAVTLNFAQPYVATGSVLATVETASYNSADNCIDFECMVPVRSGELAQYHFYWPSALAQTDTWPPYAERLNAGGGGIGSGATGNLPVGDTSTVNGIVWVGGPNVVFGASADYGDPTPTDVGFTAQTVVSPTSYTDLSNSQRPRLNLRVLIPKQLDVPKTASQAASTVIDIRKTKIYDSDHPSTPPAYLDSVFYGINDESKLVIDRIEALVGDSDKQPNGQPLSDVLKNGDDYLSIRTDVSFWNNTNGEHEFDFEYSAGSELYGAGTAWLQG